MRAIIYSIDMPGTDFGGTQQGEGTRVVMWDSTLEAGFSKRGTAYWR